MKSLDAAWGPAIAAFAVGLGLKLSFIFEWPTAFSFDGYQRWAGRDHVLVQSWLPATQSIIWLVSGAGGGILEARIAMAVVAALAASAGAILAGQMGGRTAAWTFVAASTFGPFTSWSTALYQEGTFLLVLYAGLALALSGRTTLADLVMGALCLVRYEGWPCVLLYVVWRRDLRAGVALWGALSWIGLRGGFGIDGYQASPADFDDWVGISDRFSITKWIHDVESLLYFSVQTGALSLTGAALVGGWLAIRRRIRGSTLLAAVTLLQVGAIAGWLVGLEVATHRMLVIPGMLAAVLGCVAVAWAWDAALPGWRIGGRAIGSGWLRGALVAGMAAQVINAAAYAWKAGESETRHLKPELDALARMNELSPGPWCVAPRKGLGTRARHDGCEILQGVTTLRHGQDFVCVPWLGRMPQGASQVGPESCVGHADWRRGAYVVYLGEAEPKPEPDPRSSIVVLP